MGQDRENRSQVIDFSTVFNVLKVKWKKILRVSIAFMILSAIYVYSLPRGYEATVKLAPETSSMDGIAGSMSGLASMVGISLGGGGEDAIYPEIYPEVVGSTRFITGLLTMAPKADMPILTNALTTNLSWASATLSRTSLFTTFNRQLLDLLLPQHPHLCRQGLTLCSLIGTNMP